MCSCEGVEKPEGFQIWHFYWSFSERQSGKHGSERVKIYSLYCIKLTEMFEKKEETNITVLVCSECRSAECLLLSSWQFTVLVLTGSETL